jgi:hypothetical protein
MRSTLLHAGALSGGLALLAAVGFMICATGDTKVIPRPPTIEALLLGGLALAAAAVILLVAGASHWTRWLLLLVLPALVVPFVVGLFLIPTSEVARVRLADGHMAYLGQEPVPTDVVYGLWRETNGGWLWRRVDAELTYSEDGRFVGRETLKLSADGRRLLVGRGGIWTDCLQVDRDFAPCALSLDDPHWSQADYEARMRVNSAVIETAR